MVGSSGRLLLGCCWWWWRDEGVTCWCPKAPAAARTSTACAANRQQQGTEIITSCRTPDSVRVVAGTDPSSSSTMSPHFSCAILASWCERVHCCCCLVIATQGQEITHA